MTNFINHSQFSATLTTTVHTKFQVVGLKKTSIIGEMMCPLPPSLLCHLVSSKMLQLVGHHAVPTVQVSLPTLLIIMRATAKTLMPVESTQVAL